MAFGSGKVPVKQTQAVTGSQSPAYDWSWLSRDEAKDLEARGKWDKGKTKQRISNMGREETLALYGALNQDTPEARRIQQYIDKGGLEDPLTQRLGTFLTPEQMSGLLQDAKANKFGGGDFLDDGKLRDALNRGIDPRVQSGQIMPGDLDENGRLRSGAGKQSITANAYNAFLNKPPEDLFNLDLSQQGLPSEIRDQMAGVAKMQDRYERDPARLAARESLMQRGQALQQRKGFADGEGQSIAQQRYRTQSEDLRRQALSLMASGRGGFNPAAQRLAFQSAAEGGARLAAEAQINEAAERQQALLDYLTGSADQVRMGQAAALGDVEARSGMLGMRNQLYTQGVNLQGQQKNAALQRHQMNRNDALTALNILRGQPASSGTGWRIFDAVNSGVASIGGLIGSLYGGGGGGQPQSLSSQPGSGGSAPIAQMQSGPYRPGTPAITLSDDELKKAMEEWGG